MSDISPDADVAILTPSAPELTRTASGGILEPQTGQELVLTTTVKNNDHINDWNSYVIIEVRDSNGVTILLNWQSGIIKAEGKMRAGVSWIPEYAGNYELRTFVISSLEKPRILSLVSSSQVSITGGNNECDESLWQHVYNPERLEILDNCVTVTGIIEAIRAEADGDYHILVRLDDEYADLANEENVQNQKGNLVVETVCQKPVTQQDAVSACLTYNADHIDIPLVGTHVRVTGSYVLDLQHGGWAEIHPATSIMILDQGPSGETGSTQNEAPASTPPDEEPQLLSVDIDIAHDPIVRGNIQTITVVITDTTTGQNVLGAAVDGLVTYASRSTTKSFSDITDQNGQVSYAWRIGGNSSPGSFTADVKVSDHGYQDVTASTSFDVVPAG